MPAALLFYFIEVDSNHRLMAINMHDTPVPIDQVHLFQSYL